MYIHADDNIKRPSFEIAQAPICGLEWKPPVESERPTPEALTSPQVMTPKLRIWIEHLEDL
jgi:hypothetical protein